MKRNKNTETMGHADLTPLTEHILTQMGEEGADIRERLKNFYRHRMRPHFLVYQEHLDTTA